MPDFPTLTFLPVNSLLIHERHDNQRTRPLILRIRASGVFRNPPVVTPLQDGTGRSMVLDGANRVTALKEMGFPHALVQVVPPDDPGLSLQTWNHVIWEMNPERFLTGVSAVEGLELIQVPTLSDNLDLEEGCDLAMIQSPDGEYYQVCCETHVLKERVALLNGMVESYIETARLDRTSIRDVREITDIYPSLSGLVIFPTFDIHDLLRLAGEQYLLPAGVTRFMISPRALHLNYPLESLASDQTVEEKNSALHKWIQERIAHKGIRYYAEPTYLFDE